MPSIVRADPPFSGTIFIDPDIITEADPTAFTGLEDAGRGQRLMYDRRSGWVTHDAFLFRASYNDGLSIEIQVNPEFQNVTAARVEAARFAPVIGRLPTSLRADVETVWIHMGVNPFGGGNNNLLIHTGQAANYEASGILEETFVHEASHTSLDADHAAAAGWLSAQAADPDFISTYARDNPTREDIAESFLVYLAVRHRPGRISGSLASTITNTIPNRIAYFDQQNLDMHPIVPRDPPVVTGYQFNVTAGVVGIAWTSRIGQAYAVEVSTNLVHWDGLRGGIVAQGGVTILRHTNSVPISQAFYRVREDSAP